MPSPLDLALVFLGVGLVVLIAALVAGNTLALIAGIALVLHASFAIWTTSERRQA